MFVFLNNQILSATEAKISIFDHGFLYGDGVYETLRTRNGEIFDFAHHFARLTRSAEALDIPLLLSEKELLAATEEVAKKNDNEGKDLRIRITLTRGENDFHFSGAKKPTLVISTSPLGDFSEKRKTGVKIVIIEMVRFYPEIKSTSLLPMVFAKQKAEKCSAFETIFCSENGSIAEGSVSNIILRRGNSIFFAPKKNTLTGTTQHIVLEAMKEASFQIKEREFFLDDLKKADEVLLLNSVFGVLPVAQISDFVRTEVRGEVCERAEKILLKF